MNAIGAKRIRPHEGARIVAMYYDGATFADIAAATGRTRQGVIRYLTQTGDHQPTQTRSTAATRDKAVQWYQRGISARVIAQALRMTPATIYRELDRRGINRRRRKGAP